MDIVEAYAEVLAGLVILALSVFLLFGQIIEPAYEQITINQTARADKAATFTVSINEGLGVHDQKVGRIPGIDPEQGFNRNDSGLSRMYFRPEQFIMLPAVDTDISSNANVPLTTRRNVISKDFVKVGTNLSPIEQHGFNIGLDSFDFERDYTINRESLSDKQITYNSINDNGTTSKVKGLAVYPSTQFGTQVEGKGYQHGGFNLTIDSTIDPVSKKISNSVIFVSGRVPSK